MAEKEFILKLLNINQPMADTPIRFSSIVLLLKGARKLFGCNIETGKYEMLEYSEDNFQSGAFHSFEFSALINYLIFLEQIGSKGIPSISKSKSNGITEALTHFSRLKEETGKINGIVSLRNSLVHRFGLATEKNPNKKPARKFALSIERNSDVISDWAGDFSDKADYIYTTVFIIDLIELIEEVYSKIKDEHDKDNLELILQDGLNELKARYTITY